MSYLPSSGSVLTYAGPNGSATGNIVNNGDIVQLDLRGGDTAVAIQVTGTWTGQLNFEATLDGTNWVAHEMVSNMTIGNITNATAGNGVFEASIGGLTSFRVRATAAMTGTAIVTMKSSYGIHAVELDSDLPQGVNTIGSVISMQGTSPWVDLIQGSVATVIIGGSVATSSPANQSVSGTVNIGTMPGSVLSFQSGSVAAVIIGGSIATSSPANQSVSGTVNIGTIPGSIVAFQSLPSSLLVGASIIGLPPVNITNTNLNVGGSVMAFQAGTQNTSVTSTVPSSMLVGASIFGIAPVVASGTWNVSVLSVVPLQAASNLGKATDDAWAAGHTGVPMWGVRGDILASVTGASGRYSPITVGHMGEQMVAPAPLGASVIGLASILTNSASVMLMPAGGTSVYTYLINAQVVNASAVPARISFVTQTSVGGSSTILAFTAAPASTGYPYPFPIGIRSQQNQTITVVASALTAPSVFITAQGFTSKA